MRHRHAGLCLIALFGSLSAASPARAWTRTIVDGARANVDLHSDGTAITRLRLDVEVQAGWLHELELAGLGAGLSVDRARPPYLRSDEGEVYRPEVEVVEDGRIRMSFSRREAPKKGIYRVFISYASRVSATAVKVEGRPRARVVWTLPAWETGLHDVSVELRAPRGASLPPGSLETPAGVETRLTEGTAATTFEWRRVHLPRLTPWSFTIDVPSDAFALPTPSEPLAPRAFTPLTEESPSPFSWALVAVALVALLKRRSVELTAGSRRLLIRTGWFAVISITAAWVTVAPWIGFQNAIWGLPLIAWTLHRPIREPDLLCFDEAWRPASARDLPSPSMLMGDLCDCTTWTGILVLLASSAGLVAAGEASGILVLIPLFAYGTRYHAAPRAEESARLLSRFVAQLRLPLGDPPLALGWEGASTTRQRVRLYPASHRTGLRALSFVVACQTDGILVRRRVMLLVETRAQSDADDLVRRRMTPQSELRKSNGIVARLVDWDQQALELVRVLSCPTRRPVATSRGTWLLQEICEPSKRAA